MGGDFTYQDAFMWFDNLDKLIEYANLKAAKEGLNVKLFYSTPQCYLKAVKDASPTLPTKQDDFFPYASDSTAFWTGYFTSRPTTKFMEREGNNFLQTFKMLQVLADLPKTNMFVLNELKSAMGVMQHHDAITGTEKQHVAHDYERIVSQAVEDALIIGSQAFNKFMKPVANLAYQRCEFNQSQCPVTEKSEAFVVTMYNNQAWPKPSVAVELPVVDAMYSVYDETGNKIYSETNELNPIYLSIPTRKSKATHTLSFAAQIPALGFKSFYIKREKSKQKRDANKKRVYDYYSNINDYWKEVRDRTEVDIKNVEADSYLPKFVSDIPDRDSKVVLEDRDYDKDLNWDVLKDGKDDDIKRAINEASKKLAEDALRVTDKGRKVVFSSLNDDEMRMLSDDPTVIEEPQNIVLENEHITLTMDKRTGWWNYSSKSDGLSLHFNLLPGYYIGCEGNNTKPAFRSSGAYIFRPNMTTSPELKTFQNHNIVKVLQTPGKQEIHRQYDDILTVIVGIQSNIVHITGIVQPGEGMEIVMRVQSDMETDGVFFTDSNGRQMLKRVRDRRPQWNLTLAEPIPGNYYPVVTEMYIEDSDVRLVVNVDRAKGGTSLKDGALEYMMHRRLKHDDAFGVGEALNETAGGKGLFSVDRTILQIVPKTREKLVAAATNSLSFFSPVQLFVAEAGFTLDQFKKMNNAYSFLKTPLPLGVHLLTLEPWSDGRVLIRLENYLEGSLSAVVSVDLSAMFKTVDIISVRETTLAANKWLSDHKQWEWDTEGEFSRSFNEEYGSGDVERAKERNRVADDGLLIKLTPKQIRTFVADYRIVA